MDPREIDTVKETSGSCETRVEVEIKTTPAREKDRGCQGNKRAWPSKHGPLPFSSSIAELRRTSRKPLTYLLTQGQQFVPPHYERVLYCHRPYHISASL
jgi:hypothetical protein